MDYAYLIAEKTMAKGSQKEVSRRDFMKDLGGGAIGAAIISTQILDPRLVEAATAKFSIKSGIKVQQLGGRWKEIRKVTETILKEFEDLGAKQVNWRLNESNTVEKKPVFIDWLAAKEITNRLAAKSGVKDYGEYRLGDSVPSRVYSDGLDGVGKNIVERDWDCTQLLNEKRVESRLLVQKAGLMHQKFIGIIAEQEGKRRCAGLLTISFEIRPAKSDDVNARMKQWASWPKDLTSRERPKSMLVEFIERSLVLGGPVV